MRMLHKGPGKILTYHNNLPSISGKNICWYKMKKNQKKQLQCQVQTHGLNGLASTWISSSNPKQLDIQKLKGQASQQLQQ